MQKKGASMEEYKAFSAEQVEDFTQEEMDAADRVFGEMEKTLEENGYTLPPLDEIVLIKTTMKEEPGAAAYTHGTQIYLSAYVLETYLSDTADEATARYARHIFWHELFHCLTRLAYGMDGPRGVGYPNPEIIEGIYKILKGGSN